MLLIESRPAIDGSLVELVECKYLLCHVDVCSNVGEIIHLLLSVPDALLRDHVIIPSRERMVILTGEELEVNITKVVVLADAPDLECVTKLLPVKAEESTLWIFHDRIENAL